MQMVYFKGDKLYEIRLIQLPIEGWNWVRAVGGFIDRNCLIVPDGSVLATLENESTPGAVMIDALFSCYRNS